jgi:D-aminopeptidase
VEPPGDGSIMIVVATDAPLSARNLERLAARAIMGLGRTGSFASNGSGDYVVAFSTVSEGSGKGGDGRREKGNFSNDDMSPLFAAVVEATEEAIYNSLFMATTVTSRGITVEAIPLDRVREVLAKYGMTPAR